MNALSVTQKPGSLRRSVKRLWDLRRKYSHTQDWLYSFYHRIILRFPGLPWPSRNSTRRVRLAGYDRPFYVRLGTTDWYVLEEIFIDRAYEPVTLPSSEAVRCIVDLGANTGFSLLWWQLHYPAARIIAVEPDAENLSLCARNAPNHEAGGEIRLVQACVAGKAREVSLDRSGGAWRFRMLDDAPDDKAELVKALTLPQILAENGGDKQIDLLKCDIEGAEAEVFANCSTWINQVRQIVVEIHQPYSMESFMEDLDRSGGRFKLYHRAPGQDGSQVLFLEQNG